MASNSAKDVLVPHTPPPGIHVHTSIRDQRIDAAYRVSTWIHLFQDLRHQEQRHNQMKGCLGFEILIISSMVSSMVLFFLTESLVVFLILVVLIAPLVIMSAKDNNTDMDLVHDVDNTLLPMLCLLQADMLRPDEPLQPRSIYVDRNYPPSR